MTAAREALRAREMPMAENLRIGRMYFVLLAIFTIGRFVQGAMGVPYAKAHHVFTIFVLTVLASVFYAAFCRRWQGFTVLRAMGLGATFGFVAQVVIFISTVISYLLGAHTFFNNPRALNVDVPDAVIPLAQAVAIRAPGLIIFPIINAIVAALGWAFGGMLPDGAPAPVAPVVSAPAAPRVVV
jgi:hypothetical protein